MSRLVEQWRQEGVAVSARRDRAAAIHAFEQVVLRATRGTALAARLALERLPFGDVDGARLPRALPGVNAHTIDRLGHILNRTGDFEAALDLLHRPPAKRLAMWLF